MVKPAKGAIHCRPGEAAAEATTKMQRSGAPCWRTASIDALDGRRPLSDSHIDADHIRMLLVDDGVDGDRGLAGRAVADDQLALATAEREQRVDDEDSGLDGLGDQVALDDRGCWPLHGMMILRGDRLVAVKRAAKGIDDTAEQARPNRDARHLAGAGDARAGLDRIALIEQHRADLVRVKGEGKAIAIALEAQQLAQLDVRQSGDVAMPSAICSTRPTDSACGARAVRARVSRLRRSHRVVSASVMVLACQLCGNAVEISAEAVADDGMRRVDLEAGNEVRIGFDPQFDGPAQRLGKPRSASLGLGFGRANRRP